MLPDIEMHESVSIKSKIVMELPGGPVELICEEGVVVVMGKNIKDPLICSLEDFPYFIEGFKRLLTLVHDGRL